VRNSDVVSLELTTNTGMVIGECVEVGTGLFSLAVSVTGLFGLGRFGLKALRSDYEILQKSYMLTF